MIKKQTFWNLFLFCFFPIIAIHFIKDITQDIFKVATPLDKLGNINEDLSKYSIFVQTTFSILAIVSFLSEFLLLITIPIELKRGQISKLSYLLGGIFFFLIFFFTICLLLDPQFGF